MAGLAAKYATNPALIGIELLNDPVVSGLIQQLPSWERRLKWLSFNRSHITQTAPYKHGSNPPE